MALEVRSGSPRGWTPSPLRHRRSPDRVSERRWLRGDGLELQSQSRDLSWNEAKCYPSCRIELLPILPVAHGDPVLAVRLVVLAD
jgi:hypothetical protein